MPAIKTLGIVAGGGDVPEKVASACEQASITPFIVAFEGQTDQKLFKNRTHIKTRLGAVGSIIETLKDRNITDIVLIGSIKRPSFSELRPDMWATKFFAKIGLRALGDDTLLRALRHELEKEGFTVHGAHKFAPDLLAAKGVLGLYKPSEEDMANISRGLQVSQALGRLDVGQSVIVQEGIVLGVEAIEGTDALIKRCKSLKRKGRGGVLVKTCKPHQDKDMDLPTIGPDTVRSCAEAGLCGIVYQAGHSLILKPEEVIKLADRHKIFVTGVDIDAFQDHEE